MENIINLIYNNYDNFTNSERVIADYIINHFNNITYDTLSSLANKIGVSTASIVRFAKELGFNGYSEMQESIREYAISDNPFNVSKNYKEIEDKDISEIFSRSVNKDIENLKNTIYSLPKEDLEKAITLLARARRISIIGDNDSFTLAYFTTMRFAQVKDSVHLLRAVGGMFPMEAASATDEDVLVAFLFPNYSLSTIDIINKFRNKGSKVIIITSNNIVKIKDFGDIILPTYVYGFGIRESYVAPMSLCSYLASSIAIVNPDDQELIKYTEKVMQTGQYLDPK